MFCAIIRWNFDCGLGFIYSFKKKTQQNKNKICIVSYNLVLLWKVKDFWEDVQHNRSELRIHGMSPICKDSLRFTLGLVYRKLLNSQRARIIDFSGFPDVYG